MRTRNTRIPVMLSATLSDASGRMLAGQCAEAFLISMLHTEELLTVGFNCALGAEEMHPHLAELAAKAPCLVSAHPNAGLPDIFGKYEQTPDQMAAIIREFAEEGLLNIVGGCCGTTPAHIGAIAKAVEGIAPRVPPQIKPYLRTSMASSMLMSMIDAPFSIWWSATDIAACMSNRAPLHSGQKHRQFHQPQGR